MNKHLGSVLRGLLPASMVPVFIQLMEFDDSRQINSITKEERGILISLLKAFPFTIVGLRDFKEAIITQGGVSVKEIDPSTMRCKNIQGLSFAGEAAPKAAPAPVATGSAGGVKIEAGAAGKVVKIAASAGTAVKKGDPVVVLEVMKMETPVVAPQDGTVASINCNEGQTVEAGALLATMN